MNKKPVRPYDWRKAARNANPRLSLFKSSRSRKAIGDYARPINRLVTREPGKSGDRFLTGGGPWEDKK